MRLLCCSQAEGSLRCPVYIQHIWTYNEHKYFDGIHGVVCSDNLIDVCVFCRALVEATPNKIILGIVRSRHFRVSVFRPHNWYFCQHRHGCDAWTMKRNRYIEWKLRRLCVCDDWFVAMVICLNTNTFHIPRIITMYAFTLIGTSQRTRQTHKQTRHIESIHK